jgi:hypothetical protein
LKI